MKRTLLTLLASACLVTPQATRAEEPKTELSSEALAECSSVFGILSMTNRMAGKSKEEVEMYDTASKMFRENAVLLAKKEGKEAPGQFVAIETSQYFSDWQQKMLNDADPKSFGQSAAVQAKLGTCNAMGEILGFFR